MKTMLNFVKQIAAGKIIKCKYPKHGTRNILKNHAGVVEVLGVGPNGP